MKEYYGNSWAKVVDLLESNIYKGLYQYECEIRKKENGDNKIYLPYSKGRIKLFLEIFKQKYIYIYLTFIIFFFIYSYINMALIAIIILLLNIIIKFYHDISKEKEIELLQNLNTSHVLVLREGVERLLEAEELVKGDIVYFRKNSLIAADVRVIESEGIKVDERSVTGDKFLKDKYSTKIEGRVLSIGDINNIIFRGSIIKEGSGKGIVIEVGNKTELGKLIRIMDNSKTKKDVAINKLEENLFKISLCLVLVQAILGTILPGSFIEKTSIIGTSMFSIISIAIPFIILYYGKYTKKRILEEEDIELNNFSALDLAKDVKIMFLDKVGTITKDELYLEKIYTNEQIYNSGKIEKSDININRLLEISILCNNAKYIKDNSWHKGDMFEIAYVKFGLENSIFKGNLESKNRRKFELPRDSNKNMVATVNKNKKGYRSNIRGNIDEVLECCTSILINGLEREITSKDIMKIKIGEQGFSREGLITEAFAYRSFNYEPSEQENIESNLVFVGLIALENPLVNEVQDEIEHLIKSGVLPIIFTEDNKIATEVLGRKIGLVYSENQITSGSDLDNLNSQELLDIVSKTRIYCNLKPEQKHKIVSLYNEDGYKFTIEGENIGDLSLLSLAQIGIVKGKVSMLLKKVGDVYISKSSIKAFLNLKEEGENIEKGINRGVRIYIFTVLSEIMFFNFQYLINGNFKIDEYFIIGINLILLAPIILTNMIFGKEDIEGNNKNKLLLRGLLYILTPIGLVILSKDSNEILGFILFGAMLIIDTLINNKTIKKGNIKGLKFIILSMSIFSLLVFFIALAKSYEYNTISLIIIASLISIFLISDIIIKKW
ncbi:cation-transporting P-type ATPase [Clostridium sp.]|uniref:P-type ATPase n=1 Tax=Clostridium sp. TaxID=1506 RepID=UPI002609AB84|nr:cation-transporting P-type ATPase [Clostridium sp.]